MHVRACIRFVVCVCVHMWYVVCVLFVCVCVCVTHAFPLINGRDYAISIQASTYEPYYVPINTSLPKLPSVVDSKCTGIYLVASALYLFCN